MASDSLEGGGGTSSRREGMELEHDGLGGLTKGVAMFFSGRSTRMGVKVRRVSSLSPDLKARGA